MGTYVDGILGNFRGKVGAVIGSKWRGVHYMKSKGAPRSNNFSARQIEQQARFALATRAIQALHPVLKVGYRNHARNCTAYNMALSDVLRDAIAGVHPDWMLDYGAFRISKGTLTPAHNPTVAFNNGVMTFRWDVQSDQGGGLGTDQVLLAAIAENGAVAFSIQQFTRSQQTGTLSMPLNAGNAPVHCYIAMVSSASREVSNSLYVGVVQNEN